ncbi:DUF4190 domain-containing protein [Halalkalibacillus halophilus]|uniref:DUF4190 domain-containing protein n=1 Tax=Halalkalibacillus halophilus TaxID=392827 RepID=UPI000403BE0E|nr:DUF4190 domain-containing protein [Halalkalibacillus halophilus]
MTDTAVTQQNGISSLAIASFVIGSIALFTVLQTALLSLVLGIVGLILGFIALYRVKTHRLQGRGIAWTGVIFSVVALSIPVAIMLVF